MSEKRLVLFVSEDKYDTIKKYAKTERRTTKATLEILLEEGMKKLNIFPRI